MLAGVHGIYEALDERWRELLGPQRWEQFRESLILLAVGWETVA